METIKISIIIPFYNRLGLVEKAIISVLRQTAPNWELILVDDGTTEQGLEELIKKYSSEKVRFLKRNRLPKGAPTCRNIGADNAIYDYLLFFDSDDIMAYWAIEERTKIIKKNIDKDFFIFDGITLNNNNIQYYKSRTIFPNLSPILSFLDFQATWQTSCVIWKKEVFYNINGWDEKTKSWQDGEVHIRLLLTTNNYYWDNSLPDFFVRGHNDNITGEYSIDKVVNMFETYNNILNKLGENSFYYIFFRKVIALKLYNEIEFNKKYDIKKIRELVKSNKIVIQKKTIFILYSKLYEIFGDKKILKFFFWQLRKIGIPNKRRIFWNERKLYTEIEIQQLKEKVKNDEFIKNEFLFFSD